MAGYWQNEEATREALRDGWLHTGDIGTFDERRPSVHRRPAEGCHPLRIVSIMPKEVEDVIAAHPAVGEVAVLGLPDTEWGEAVTAFVVLKPGMRATEHELVEHCRAHLAGYKKPRAVRFVASLPRSHYGKVIRAELLRAGSSDRRARYCCCAPIFASRMILAYFAISMSMYLAKAIRCRADRIEAELVEPLPSPPASPASSRSACRNA